MTRAPPSRRMVPLRTAIVVQVVATLIIVNATIGIMHLASQGEPPQPPRVSVDGTGRPVETLAQLQNGTAFRPFHRHVLVPTLDSEMAGKGRSPDPGNVYAPDIMLDDDGTYKMWYGGQGSDGHDAIHLATSTDGIDWYKYGVVIPTGNNNHVNDPSVVKVNGTYYMYYTVAPVRELDEIWLATSPDGATWTVVGQVLGPTATGWESLKVGRPSVLHENGTFKMWYDGSEEDPGRPGEIKPGSGRHVGYAFSDDGYTWIRWHANPVFLHSGAIDVKRFDGKYVVVEESGGGVLWRAGTNETTFPASPSWLFTSTGAAFDGFGHVTPFIMIEHGRWTAVYTGAATAPSWDRNRIAAWFPVYNVSLVVDGGVRPGGWLGSRARVEWTLDTASIGHAATIQRWSGATVASQASFTIPAGTTTFFLVNGTLQRFA